MSKWTKIVFTILTILLGSVCILAGALLAYSPGEPKPHLDQTGNKIKGSISEKTFVAINGVEQVLLWKLSFGWRRRQEEETLLRLFPEAGNQRNHFLAEFKERRHNEEIQ